MCNPIVPAVLLAGATAAQVVGQMKVAKAQAKAINEQSAVRAEEIQDAATAELVDRQIETFQRIGQARVVGASRGLNDASRVLEQTTQAILFDNDFDAARIEKNAETQQRARLAETKSALAGASRPSLLGAGLQIIAAGAQGYAAGGGFAKAPAGGAS
jgi:hypothetical protein